MAGGESAHVSRANLVCLAATGSAAGGISAGQTACQRLMLHFSHGHSLRLSNVSAKHLFEACLPLLERLC